MMSWMMMRGNSACHWWASSRRDYGYGGGRGSCRRASVALVKETCDIVELVVASQGPLS